MRAPQNRAVRADEAVAANLDRFFDETAGVDLSGLEVHVSSDESVIPNVNELQIVERYGVELNALADLRSTESVEGIQNRGPPQDSKRYFKGTKQVVKEEPAKVLWTPELALLALAAPDREHDQECNRHRGQGHQRQPQRACQ